MATHSTHIITWEEVGQNRECLEGKVVPGRMRMKNCTDDNSSEMPLIKLNTAHLGASKDRRSLWISGWASKLVPRGFLVVTAHVSVVQLAVSYLERQYKLSKWERTMKKLVFLLLAVETFGEKSPVARLSNSSNRHVSSESLYWLAP